MSEFLDNVRVLNALQDLNTRIVEKHLNNEQVLEHLKAIDPLFEAEVKRLQSEIQDCTKTKRNRGSRLEQLLNEPETKRNVYQSEIDEINKQCSEEIEEAIRMVGSTFIRQKITEKRLQLGYLTDQEQEDKKEQSKQKSLLKTLGKKFFSRLSTTPQLAKLRVYGFPLEYEILRDKSEKQFPSKPMSNFSLNTTVIPPSTGFTDSVVSSWNELSSRRGGSRRRRQSRRSKQRSRKTTRRSRKLTRRTRKSNRGSRKTKKTLTRRH